MEGDYRDPFTIPLPNYVAIRAVAQVLAQRAQCFLLLGQSEKSLKELALLHDLTRLLEAAPTGKPMTMVAAMINAPVTGFYSDVVADGIRLHAWSESQLSNIQNQLERINLAPFVVEAFRGERAGLWHAMRKTIWARFEVKRAPQASLWQKMKNMRPPNLLKGIFCLNMVTVSELHQQLIDSIDPAQKTIHMQKLKDHLLQQEKIGRRFSPYTFFASIAVPNFIPAVRTLGYNQTRVAQAQIACALERFRIAHGQYPTALSELTPQCIPKLPHDIIEGNPLKYRPVGENQFLLYSVGWNESDDDGQFSAYPYEAGDWSW